MNRRIGRFSSAALFLVHFSQAGSVQASDAAQIETGRKAFIANGCGWCHDDGGKKPGRCPQLMNDVKSDDELTARIATGAPGRMPAFGSALKADDIKAIIVYIRSLKP